MLMDIVCVCVKLYQGFITAPLTLNTIKSDLKEEERENETNNAQKNVKFHLLLMNHKYNTMQKICLRKIKGTSAKYKQCFMIILKSKTYT